MLSSEGDPGGPGVTSNRAVRRSKSRCLRWGEGKCDSPNRQMEARRHRAHSSGFDALRDDGLRASTVWHTRRVAPLRFPLECAGIRRSRHRHGNRQEGMTTLTWLGAPKGFQATRLTRHTSSPAAEEPQELWTASAPESTSRTVIDAWHRHSSICLWYAAPRCAIEFMATLRCATAIAPVVFRS
jgi:hypothetical protein